MRKKKEFKQTRNKPEYQTIKRLNKQGFKIKLLCKALSVSRAGYYKWLNRKPTKSERRLNHLIDLIQHAYHEHKVIYGYRRMTIFLRSEEHTSELQSRGHLLCRLLLEKNDYLLI